MAARQSGDAAGGMAIFAARPYGNHISAARILALSIVSCGFYLFYWVYRTWEQYRQHTSARVHPVWHALAMAVPIYGWFRFYAHIRAYRDLMDAQSVPHTMNLTRIMVATIVCTAMWSPIPTVWLNFYLGGSATSVLIDLILDVVSLVGIVAATIVVCHIQANINRYWAASDDALTHRARVGKGGVALCVLGVIIWAAIVGYYAGYYFSL